MDFIDQANRTPIAYIVLIGYLTMAFLTDPISPKTESLLEYGACMSFLVQDGEAWRLLSHAFLHGGLLHLGLNSWFLIMFGPMLEERLGMLRFIGLYVVSAVGGGIGGCLFGGGAPLVGGSGALFGMLGAALALNMRQGRHPLEFLNYYGPRSLVGLILINIVIGIVVPFISNSAHMGGLIAGFALTFCFYERGREAPDRTSRAIQAGWLAAFASLLFYVAQPVVSEDYLDRKIATATSFEAASRYVEAQLLRGPIAGLESGGTPVVLDDLDDWRQFPRHDQEAIVGALADGYRKKAEYFRGR